MKSTFQRSLVAVLFLVAVWPPGAQAEASVYADDITSGVVAANSAPVAETNAPAAKGNETNIALSEKATVRIDKAGIHIGGAHPVDINVPSLASHRKDTGIDVVGIVGVVFGCTIPIAIVAIIFYSRHRRLKMHHETMRAMIEKGMPIPPEMVAAARGDVLLGNGDVRPGRNDLRGGLILVAIGAALLMIAGKVGWILVFIGTARLVVWLIADRSPKA